jgi:hypothetical protein
MGARRRDTNLFEANNINANVSCDAKYIVNLQSA